jgi:hypothetical protein
MNYEKNVTNIFKKIIINGEKKILTDLYVKKIMNKSLKYKIIECSFAEIKKSIEKYV